MCRRQAGGCPLKLTHEPFAPLKSTVRHARGAVHRETRGKPLPALRVRS